MRGSVEVGPTRRRKITVVSGSWGLRDLICLEGNRGAWKSAREGVEERGERRGEGKELVISSRE